MNIKIKSELFRDGLNKILTVIDKRNSRPILTNCFVNVENNNLEIIATDLEVAAKIKLDAVIEGQGSFCLNIKNIVDILRELPVSELNININQDKNILELNCNDITYNLLISSSEEYPQISFENSIKSFNIHSKAISKIISKTSHAISNDETRINLNGIYLQELDSKLRAVAIDGHRLAMIDIQDFNSNNQALRDGVIIPKKGVYELKKIADVYDGDLEISLDESFLYLNAGNEYCLSIRLIAREYPKYQTVIPNKTTYIMYVNKELIQNAVKRIKILSNEKTNGIKFGINDNVLTISANHPSYGHAFEKIETKYSGENIEIGFNAKYMIEALSAIEDDNIIFEFNNELSPVVCKSETEPNYLGIIMPLKL